MVDLAYDAYRNAEAGLLGSILIDAEYCLNEIILEVTEDDFATSEARTIWRAITELHSDGVSVDPYTVKSRVPDAYTKLVDKITGTTPTSANWSAYLSELKRHAKLSKTRMMAKDILNDATIGTSDISEIRQKVEQLLTVLESADSRKTDYTMREMVRSFLDGVDKPRNYLDWGMQRLNEAILCEPGDYVLIGATPSVGKTALTVQLGVSMASRGKRVLYFSYETTQKKIMERVIACWARIPYQTIKKGTYAKEEHAKYTEASRELYKLPFSVIEAGGMTVEDIRAKAIKYQADVIFIDYIQQVAHTNEKLSEYQRITEVSRGIQQICQKYKIITIALSQFSRLDGRKPTLSSFRSSGQLEQDINVGVLFYRPEEVEEGQPDNKRIFEIAKNKDGMIGKLKMWFDGDYQTFTAVDERR